MSRYKIILRTIEEIHKGPMRSPPIKLESIPPPKYPCEIYPPEMFRLAYQSSKSAHLNVPILGKFDKKD